MEIEDNCVHGGVECEPDECVCNCDECSDAKLDYENELDDDEDEDDY